MVLKKNNIERVAEGEAAASWKKKGYVEMPEETTKIMKSKYEMSLDELRAAAAKHGIPVEKNITKKKLLELLMGVTI